MRLAIADPPYPGCLEPTDEFVDLFPGSGAITRAHEKWCGQFDFEVAT